MLLLHLLLDKLLWHLVTLLMICMGLSLRNRCLTTLRLHVLLLCHMSWLQIGTIALLINLRCSSSHSRCLNMLRVQVLMGRDMSWWHIFQTVFACISLRLMCVLRILCLTHIIM